MIWIGWHARGFSSSDAVVARHLLVWVLDWPDSRLPQPLPSVVKFAPTGTEIPESTPVSIFLVASKIWNAEVASRPVLDQ